MLSLGEKTLSADGLVQTAVTSCILMMQQNLEVLAQALAVDPAKAQPRCTETCAAFFTRLLEESAARGKIFGDLRLFEDPAWNILVDLYVSESRKIAVSISSACIAACVPASTALRWIAALEDAGLVQRSNDSTDARRRYLRLSDKGKDLLTEYYERCSKR